METPANVSFTYTLLSFAAVVFLITLGVLLLNQHFKKRLYQQQAEKETLKTLHQSELLRASVKIQEDERRRIARDLHDELGAALSMTRMHLVQTEQQLPEHSERLQNVRSMIEQAMASLRRISYELTPPQLENFGLLKTLESTAGSINRIGNLQVDVSGPAVFVRSTLATELTLFRVCLELINNTLRHANAQNAWIVLDTTGQKLNVHYRDDGKGFIPDTGKKGIGLKSMETRIQSLNGKFDMLSAPGKGIEVHIEVPEYI